MAMTNRGVANMEEVVFQGATPPTNFYAALVTSATAPTVDTNTLGELTEIAAGNGYTAGGIQLSRNAVDFAVTEDDGNDRADTVIKDLVWTATGGALPASGSGASYLVLTDDNGTLGSREVWAYWDLSGPISVSSGQSLTVQDATMRGTT